MRSPNGHNGNGHNNHRRNNNGNNRGPRPNNGGGNMGGNNRRPNPQNLRNQVFDSHGPGGERVRGNAFQVHEKYLSLARDAEERIDQENYYQHAEHYYRIVQAIQEMEAEQRARFTVVENADPFAANGDGFGDQPDVSTGNRRSDAAEQDEDNRGNRAEREPRPERQERQERQPRHNNQQGDRPQRQPRGPITQSDVMSEVAAEREPIAPLTGNSEPMFSLSDQGADQVAEQPSTDENSTDSTDGADGDTPTRGRRGTRRPAVTA